MIVGAVSWWDESPTWLSNTITSMSRFCDHIVALDGHYELYPDDRTQSPIQQMYAIIDAARAAGVGVTVEDQNRVWRDEMQKRTRLFELAQTVADLDDWIFVLDADERVQLGDGVTKNNIKETLDTATSEGSLVCIATLTEYIDTDSDPILASASRNAALPSEPRTHSPRFFRSLPNMRVADNHFDIRADLGAGPGGGEIKYWGMRPDVKHSTRLESMVFVENLNRLRGKVRDDARRVYYKQRDELGAENLE